MKLFTFVSVWLSIAIALAAQASDSRSAEYQSEEPRLVPQLGHVGPVLQVAFSPDGRFVLTGGWDGVAKLWDAQTGSEIRIFRGAVHVTALAFSADGRLVFIGSYDVATLRDTQSVKEIRDFSARAPDFVTSAAFSPDDRFIVAGSTNRTAKLWDVASGQLIKGFTGHSDTVTSVAFSPDGRFLVTGSFDRTVRLWDVHSGAQVRTLVHTYPVTSVAFSPDGRFVLAGGLGNKAVLWDSGSGAEVRSFSVQSEPLSSVAFSPDGQQVLTGGWDGTSRLWDTQTGAEIRAFSGHPAGQISRQLTLFVGRSVAFSPDGRFVLTGSYEDESATLWDALSGASIRDFSGHADALVSVAFSPDGRLMLTGGRGNIAKIWDAQSGRQTKSLSGHSDTVTSVAFSFDGHFVLTGSADNTAKLWDAQSGVEIRTFSGHTQGVNAVAFSPDGRLVLTGSSDHMAKVWDARSGTVIKTFSIPTGEITSVAFSPDGQFVLTGSSSMQTGTASLWDTRSGAEVRTFAGHSNRVVSVAFSPDGRFVLTGGWDHTSKLWDAQSGEEIKSFSGHFNSVESVAFSPDGRLVATASADHTARLWDPKSGTEIRAFKGHSQQVESVAFSPDGRVLLTASEDLTAKLWDLASGRELCSLISFDDSTWAVVDPEGRFDASNGGEIEWLHWVVGLEPIALSQLKDRYYEPGLLAKLLGFNPEPLRDVQAFRKVKLFPEIRAGVLPGSTKLKIDLVNRGGGIGRVRVLVNGKEVAADARGSELLAQTNHAALTVNLTGASVIPGQENKIEVVAWNADGYLSSRGVKVIWTPPVTKGQEISPPHLFAIVGGISRYAGDRINLRYPAKDAVDFSKALQIGAKRLFGTEKVTLRLLTTAPESGAIAPTKSHFHEAFLAVASEARPQDILVVYLAGHGVSVRSESDLYCYLTQEAQTTDLTDPAIRSNASISSEELTEWITKIPALKQVMILDTCAAGAATPKLIDRRELPSDQIRAIERLKDRTGFHVLMGSAANAASYEASIWTGPADLVAAPRDERGRLARGAVCRREQTVSTRGRRSPGAGKEHRGNPAAGDRGPARNQLRHRTVDRRGQASDSPCRGHAADPAAAVLRCGDAGRHAESDSRNRP
jgi:WD40 repeat protein